MNSARVPPVSPSNNKSFQFDCCHNSLPVMSSLTSLLNEILAKSDTPKTFWVSGGVGTCVISIKASAFDKSCPTTTALVALVSQVKSALALIVTLAILPVPLIRSCFPTLVKHT